MKRNKIRSNRLQELYRQMANKFKHSFGHDLTDQEREENWKEYQKLRTEYLSEYQKLCESWWAYESSQNTKDLEGQVRCSS